MPRLIFMGLVFAVTTGCVEHRLFDHYAVGGDDTTELQIVAPEGNIRVWANDAAPQFEITALRRALAPSQSAAERKFLASPVDVHEQEGTVTVTTSLAPAWGSVSVRARVHSDLDVTLLSERGDIMVSGVYGSHILSGDTVVADGIGGSYLDLKAENGAYVEFYPDENAQLSLEVYGNTQLALPRGLHYHLRVTVDPGYAVYNRGFDDDMVDWRGEHRQDDKSVTITAVVSSGSFTLIRAR